MHAVQLGRRPHIRTTSRVQLPFDWPTPRGKMLGVPTKQVLPRMPTNQMRVLPVHVSPAQKFTRVTGEKIDFYHSGI